MPAVTVTEVAFLGRSDASVSGRRSGGVVDDEGRWLAYVACPAWGRHQRRHGCVRARCGWRREAPAARPMWRAACGAVREARQRSSPSPCSRRRRRRLECAGRPVPIPACATAGEEVTERRRHGSSRNHFGSQTVDEQPGDYLRSDRRRSRGSTTRTVSSASMGETGPRGHHNRPLAAIATACWQRKRPRPQLDDRRC